jgi:hypothetical protein
MALLLVPTIEAQTECVSKLVPCFNDLNTTTTPVKKITSNPKRKKAKREEKKKNDEDDDDLCGGDDGDGFAFGSDY